MDIGEAEVASGMAEGEAFVVQAEQMKDGGMQVMHVDFAGNGEVAELIPFRHS